METLSDEDFLLTLAKNIHVLLVDLSVRVDMLDKKADHIDVQVHEISQFIEEHRPALARGLALMSAGTRLGAWRKPKD